MAAMCGLQQTSPMRRAARLVWLLLHLLRGLFTVAVVFPFLSAAGRREAIRRWSEALMHIVGVKLCVHDAPVRARPLMLVANHVSWLDIFSINAVLAVRFVAKSEIRRWPAIGWLSARTGTLFIERGRRADTARVNRLMADAMRAGDVVAVFPEGTTTDGSRVLRFHGALLQPALIAGARIQPVALSFRRRDGSRSTEAAYDGDKTLWQTLNGILAQPGIEVHLHFLPVLADDLPQRRALADAAHAAIASRLQR